MFAFAAFASLFWAGYKYESVRSELVDSFPPEFQDEVASRFALRHYALRPSTPLRLQADYVASLIGGCLMGFFLLLLVLSAGDARASWVFLAVLLIGIASTVKPVRTYLKNRSRAMTGHESDQA